MAVDTALTYVQLGLSYIDADNVSEIGESLESTQVFDMLKLVYDELLDQFNWPHLRESMTLQVTSDAHIMRLPTDAVGFDWIRYNKKDVTYIEPKEMQELLDSRDTTAASVDSNGAITDSDPRWWTTVDDDNIIFDSYNVSLQASLSQIYGVRKPADLTTDTSRPDIPERMETALRHLLIAEVLRILKADETRADTYDRMAERDIQRLKRWAKRFNRNKSWHGPTYGRKNTSIQRGRTPRVIEG